jgi:hypothetical protein
MAADQARHFPGKRSPRLTSPISPQVSTDETFNLLGSLSHAAAVSGWLLSQPAYEALAMQCNVTLAEQASLSLNSLCFDAWWTEVLDAKAGESVLAAFDSPKGRDLVAKGAVNGTAQVGAWSVGCRQSIKGHRGEALS